MNSPFTGKMQGMEAAQIDFQQLRIKHILYKSKVRSVVYGGSFEESFFSPAGPVEQWFQAVGLSRYGHLPEMRALFQAHQQLNATALQLIQLYRRGQIDQAHNDLKVIEKQSEAFLANLSELERRLA
ncbi:MAG: histidine kinase [Adhaeribacter sp.]